MSSGLYWLFHRQYVPSYENHHYEVSFMDKLIDQFSCSRDDSYNINGTMGMPIPPFVACFSTDLLKGNMLAVADEDGDVKLIDTSKTKDSSILKEWSAHSNAIFDLAWIEKESKMVTASGDQTARLWDIEKCVTIGNFRGHTCSLKSIAVQPGSSRILLTGARDGNIMVWDTRCNLRNGYHTPINTIHKSHDRVRESSINSTSKRKKKRPSCLADSKQSVTAAVFLDDCRIISAGACDGAIKYWDIRKNYTNMKGDAMAYHVINFAGRGPRKHGFSSLILNSSGSRLFSVCTNNIIYEFPTTNLSSQPIATYQGHRASSFYVKAALSPDDRYLLCGSGDKSAYIWRTDQSINVNPWMLSGHSREVTSVAWSSNNGEKLVTCSDDNTFKIWRPFQENSDPLLACGSIKRKTSVNNTNTADKGAEVTLQEDVLDLDIPDKKQKCFCNTLNMASNRKVRVRWNVRVVQHAKDTSSKTSARTKTWSASSPYTNITPKSSNNPTPTHPLCEKFNTSPSNCTVQKQSCDVTATVLTPTSSRVFMESWLKSPKTPGRDSPVSSNLERREGRFLFPDSSDHPLIGEQTPEKTNNALQSKDDTIENQENKMFWYKHLKHNSNANSRSPSPQPSKKKSGRSKRCVKTGQFVDIKSMLLSMKRKCTSPSEVTESSGKRSKAETVNSTALDAVELPESNVSTDAMHLNIYNDKENNPDYIKMNSPNDNLGSKQESKDHLSNNHTQKDVKDILDYAGDLPAS